jgi:hypothetical protein
MAAWADAERLERAPDRDARELGLDLLARDLANEIEIVPRHILADRHLVNSAIF